VVGCFEHDKSYGSRKCREHLEQQRMYKFLKKVSFVELIILSFDAVYEGG
jgi:hypothetical protein